jgi:hypothetical protein
MCPSPDHDKSIQDALAAVQAAASRFSLKNKFEMNRAESATRVGNLRGQQQRFQQLNKYCNRAIAEISASLALLWQIFWIDRRNWIPESGFQ